MYAEHFGLSEPAFSVTPDPRFFFSNPAYEEAYANLVYGISSRKGFVMLAGEVGTGKTTLLRRLMENLEPNAAFVFLFNPRLTFDEMLSFVCDELDIKPAGTERLRKIQALNDFLLEQVRKSGTTALLIDEAQDLGDDVLEDFRLLSNLETRGEKLLQIVLVGQPELETKLARPELRQLRQRVTLRCRLDRLKMREIGAFIEHRLRVAGYRDTKPLFTPEAVLAIARLSRGIPRLVNVICDNALLIAYGMSCNQVNEGIVAEVAADLQLATVATQAGITAAGLDHALKAVEAGVARVAQPAPRRKVRRPDRTDVRTLGWAGLLIILLGLGGGSIAALRAGVEPSTLAHLFDEMWEFAAPAAAREASPPRSPAALLQQPEAIAAVAHQIELPPPAAPVDPVMLSPELPPEADDETGLRAEPPATAEPRIERPARARDTRGRASRARAARPARSRTAAKAAAPEAAVQTDVPDADKKSVAAERVRFARPFPTPFANGARCVTQPSDWISSSWRHSGGGAQWRPQP